MHAIFYFANRSFELSHRQLIALVALDTAISIATGAILVLALK